MVSQHLPAAMRSFRHPMVDRSAYFCANFANFFNDEDHQSEHSSFSVWVIPIPLADSQSPAFIDLSIDNTAVIFINEALIFVAQLLFLHHEAHVIDRLEVELDTYLPEALFRIWPSSLQDRAKCVQVDGARLISQRFFEFASNGMNPASQHQALMVELLLRAETSPDYWSFAWLQHELLPINAEPGNMREGFWDDMLSYMSSFLLVYLSHEAGHFFLKHKEGPASEQLKNIEGLSTGHAIEMEADQFLALMMCRENPPVFLMRSPSGLGFIDALCFNKIADELFMRIKFAGENGDLPATGILWLDFAMVLDQKHRFPELLSGYPSASERLLSSAALGCVGPGVEIGSLLYRLLVFYKQLASHMSWIIMDGLTQLPRVEAAIRDVDCRRLPLVSTCETYMRLQRIHQMPEARRQAFLSLCEKGLPEIESALLGERFAGQPTFRSQDLSAAREIIEALGSHFRGT